MSSTENTAENALISIIIPVYNCKETIEKSVKSCLEQTYTKLEIILVDDGSTDGSGGICDRLALMDKRVKVFHQKNQGVSAARNKGLEIFTGTYISFLDADDLLHPCAIERMYLALSNSGSQLAFCRFSWIHSLKQFEHAIQNEPDEKNFHFSARKVLEEIIYKEPFTGSCCGKLFNRKLVEKRSFFPLSMGEDQVFVLEILSTLIGNAILVGKTPLYFYFQRSDSAMHTLSLRHLQDELQSVEYIFNITRSADVEIKKAALCYSVNVAFFAHLNSKDAQEYSEVVNKALRIIKENRMEMIKSTRIPLKTKGACLLSYLSMDALKNFYRLIKH